MVLHFCFGTPRVVFPLILQERFSPPCLCRRELFIANYAFRISFSHPHIATLAHRIPAVPLHRRERNTFPLISQKKLPADLAETIVHNPPWRPFAYSSRTLSEGLLGSGFLCATAPQRLLWSEQPLHYE